MIKNCALTPYYVMEEQKRSMKIYIVAISFPVNKLRIHKSVQKIIWHVIQWCSNNSNE